MNVSRANPWASSEILLYHPVAIQGHEHYKLAPFSFGSSLRGGLDGSHLTGETAYVETGQADRERGRERERERERERQRQREAREGETERERERIIAETRERESSQQREGNDRKRMPAKVIAAGVVTHEVDRLAKLQINPPGRSI